MSVLQYQVRQKSPLKLFAVFSAIALNFSVKFYVFMCTVAKQHLTSCVGGCNNMPSSPES